MRMGSIAAIVCGLVVCGLTGVVIADGDTTWDGTYQLANNDNDNAMCPGSGEPFVVSSGKFSIPWNVKVNGKAFHVGQIRGSVRASGKVMGLEPKLLDPTPPAAVEALAPLGATPTGLHNIASDMRATFTIGKERKLEIVGGMCRLSWTAPLDKSKKPAPASTVKAPPPLPAGAAKWDGTFKNISGYRQDWRCPREFENVVVKQGRFSLPWRVDGDDGHGGHWGVVTLGQIDGSIAASGNAKLRPWLSVDEIPPEIADGRDPSEMTLAAVTSFTGTMTFSTAHGARVARYAFGKDGSVCEYNFEDNRTFKPGYAGQGQSPASRGVKCRSDHDCKSGICENNRCMSKEEDDTE